MLITACKVKILFFGVLIISAVVAACADDSPTHEFRPMTDSPYATLIPKCSHLETRSGQQISRFQVLNPDSEFYVESHGEESISITEANCREFVVSITEFASTPLARQYIANQRALVIPFSQYPAKTVRLFVQYFYDEANFFSARPADYDSIFREPYWIPSRNYVTFANEWDYAEDTGTPFISEGVDLGILVQDRKLVIKYGRYSPKDVDENSGEEFFAALEALRDDVDLLMRGLEDE